MSPLAYRRRAGAWRDSPHPFAQRRLPSTDGATTFRSPVTGALYALVADHVVQGRVIFPGAAYLELARAAATPGSSAKSTVFFLQPLIVEQRGAPSVAPLLPRVELLPQEDRKEVAVQQMLSDRGYIQRWQNCWKPRSLRTGRQVMRTISTGLQVRSMIYGEMSKMDHDPHRSVKKSSKSLV